MALQLLTNQRKLGGPILDIRWCLSKTDMEKLRQESVSVSFVQVLIVVAYEDGQEERDLRPLNDIQTQMLLHFPGKHKMFARLVWPTNASAKALKSMRNELLSEHQPHRYKNHVLDYNRENFIHHLDVENAFFSRDIEYGGYFDGCSIDIEVDKEHFAPEPSAWMKRWVNLWFRYKSPDQCAFRRRKIWAFSGQPFVMGAFSLCRMIAWFLLWTVSQFVVGYRGVSPLLLLHPWRTSLDDFDPKIMNSSGRWGRSSWFFEASDGKEQPWRLLFCPAIYGILFLIIWTIHHFGNKTWWNALEILGFGIFIVCVSSVTYKLMNWLDDSGRLRRFEKWVTGRLNRYRDSKIVDQNPDRLSAIQNALICATATKLADPTALTSLPKEAQTVRLKFLDFKARVCKPFAGG